MHKKLAADLTSLAHSILQMKNKEDVFALKAKAHDVYEKLALLAYVEEYINTTPNATANKETLIASIIEAEKTQVLNKKEEITIASPEILETAAVKLESSLENNTDKELLVDTNTNIQPEKDNNETSLLNEETDTIIATHEYSEIEVVRLESNLKNSTDKELLADAIIQPEKNNNETSLLNEETDTIIDTPENSETAIVKLESNLENNTDKEQLADAIIQPKKDNNETSLLNEETDTIIAIPENSEIKDEIIKSPAEEETPVEDDIVIGNKFTQDITFTINKPIQESLFTEPEEKEDENNNIEQPFDELEDILFGNASFKDEASFIEGLKSPNNTEEETSIEEESTPIEDNTIKGGTIIIEKMTSQLVTEERIAEESKKETITSKEETVIPKEVITTKEEPKKPTLEDELKGTLSVDIMTNLFEKAPVKRTLNDRAHAQSVKIDLNDRIAFVKNLFDGNQEDFNRVISQLNTLKTEKEAKDFILKMIKPDYDWTNKEAYEIRLLDIIERRFN